MAAVVLDMSTDDYVAPSAACINPLFAAPSSSSSSASTQQPATKKPRGAAKISIDSGIFSNLGSGTGASTTTNEDPFNVGSGIVLKKPAPHSLIKQNERKTARVTLNDCLACSGCVTSAETVLIESQSADKFYEAMERVNNPTEVSNALVALSISPQSTASLAAHFNVSATEMHTLLSHFFKSLGVHVVCSTQGE